MKSFIKYFFILSILVICFASLSSCQKETDQSMTVIKNCTGVYLRFASKDYHVCNIEKVGNIPDGTIVTASFKKINQCNGEAVEQFVCLMLYPNEGWIEVQKIRR